MTNGKRRRSAPTKPPCPSKVAQGGNGTANGCQPIKSSANDGNERIGSEEQWSKSKKKRMRSQKGKNDQVCNSNQTSGMTPEELPHSGLPTTKVHSELTLLKNEQGRVDRMAMHPAVSSLQRSFQERLSGSRFRILNEELYTSTSSSAFDRFQQNPTLFDEYHEGFRHQVEQWPVNPVTVLVKRLSTSSLQKKQSQEKIVVADFGCGDAVLARQLLSIRHTKTQQCPFVVHSFDMVARGPNADLITACDAAHTPLDEGSVDIGIFCLSLMGTNLSDFIREAHRVLKPQGRLHIAEVRSRFENVGRKDDNARGKGTSAGKGGDLQTFLLVLDELGFRTCHTDRSNTMFLLLDLEKNGKTPKQDLSFTAKPCIYKRR
jgi:ribosomal RNA-processing protein 8